MSKDFSVPRLGWEGQLPGDTPESESVESQTPEVTEHHSNIVESPWWEKTRPRDAMSYFEGIAVAMAYLGMKATPVTVGEENLRALSENEFKHLANEAAWKAIEIFKRGEIHVDGKGDYQDLENRFGHLMELVTEMPHQDSDAQTKYPLNS